MWTNSATFSGKAHIGSLDVVELAHRVRIGEQLKCVFERFEFLGADEHGSGTAVAGDDDPVVGVLDAVDHFGELRLHGRQRQTMTHPTIQRRLRTSEWGQPALVESGTIGCQASWGGTPAPSAVAVDPERISGGAAP